MPRPDPFERPTADRASIFSDAGRTSYRAAKAVSDIDTLLAGNKNALTGESILDRLMPLTPQDEADYRQMESQAIAHGNNTGYPATSIGPDEIAEEYHFTGDRIMFSGTPEPGGQAPRRLSDPHDLHSPYAPTQEQAYRELRGASGSNNIDTLNLMRQQGTIPIEPSEAEGVVRVMGSGHSKENVFDPTTTTPDLTESDFGGSHALGEVTRRLHLKLMEDPDKATRYMSPQFVGSTYNNDDFRTTQSLLTIEGIDQNAAYTKYAPRHTADVYMQHDPESQRTTSTVRFPGTDRELYSLEHTGPTSLHDFPSNQAKTHAPKVD